MSDSNPPNDKPTPSWDPLLSRRALLSSGAVGLAAIYGLKATRGLGAVNMADLGAAGTVTFGSNYSDQVPKAAIADVMSKFTAQSGIDVKVNTVDHNTFQQQINSYLQGQPDDVFTWFAGYRMQFFAQKGLLTPIDDVWASLKSQFSPALQAASTGLDGHKYFVPIYNYPWAIFYRKSVFKKHGYKIPKTWDQYLALAKKMKKDGLIPIAFTDKDGWPAMGTFDYLNMRINGYAYHIALMHGNATWDSAKVRSVFEHWAQLMPYFSKGALGLTWEEGAQQLATKKAGMFLLGSFVGQQFTQNNKLDPDLDFFPFPVVNPKYGQDSVEAPIDGFLIPKNPKNADGAKKLIAFLGSAVAADAYLATDPNDVGTNKGTSTAHYNTLQKKSAQLIGNAKSISQFLDRDTRPDFASTVMIPSLQQFLNNPKDIKGLCKSIQKQKKAIFASP
ncbi:MAG: ABC transporter substrate-binding protein [Gaiellaceae bacterium]